MVAKCVGLNTQGKKGPEARPGWISNASLNLAISAQALENRARKVLETVRMHFVTIHPADVDKRYLNIDTHGKYTQRSIWDPITRENPVEMAALGTAGPSSFPFQGASPPFLP